MAPIKHTLQLSPIFAAAAMVILITACGMFGAEPFDCIEAAERTGLPDKALDQLRNPGDLNDVERAELRRLLKEAHIDRLCNLGPDLDLPEPSDGDGQPKQDTDPTQEPEPSPQVKEQVHDTDEYRRRCKFWALNNMRPVVYAEFAALDPDKMDDLDRILWRSKLNVASLGFHQLYDETDEPVIPDQPGIYCRDYWAEPLDRSNASLRNHQYEVACRQDIEGKATARYRALARAIDPQEGNRDLAFRTPNQYIRILRWLDITGDQLLDSQNPPYQILSQQSSHQYAYVESPFASIEAMEQYEISHDENIDLEWLGIIHDAQLDRNSSSPNECHAYYPQLFYGYWVPFTANQELADQRPDAWTIPHYDPATTPLYLPRRVATTNTKAGYPIGMTYEGYLTCENHHRLEELGYYYVQHPSGDYCEPK